MSARGMLQNPAMFAGYDETPLQCVRDWVSWVVTSIVEHSHDKTNNIGFVSDQVRHKPGRTATEA